ncbi:MAG: tRNA (N6-threonylcarbamoyladenosine(37)-N6)-methyltransferase TrmO [Bacteroidaceae bacterium]|nr:tRNA (N6-threonylcarbamoyladenosine(37)-N6)-methyltransferase TrmO [Bacteroidaceae bacterium]MCF0194191.1 tRNA (N6-threonylcarbamoyladenosine(37)-N6)-methyltransferase TrmO [Bacteroidaceae bacterium]
MNLIRVATFHSPFTSKFGIPRQSGLVENLRGRIIFERQFRDAEALRGIEGFDWLWLLWGFSANLPSEHHHFTATVRPPVLGGNERLGVWATRSPNRPNPIGLSSVHIERVEMDSADGPILHVLGADLMDGTPIYDIKPYVPFTDSHPDAQGGFSAPHVADRLTVTTAEGVALPFNDDDRRILFDCLACDPRPRYHDDPSRIYGMPFMGFDVHFSVNGDFLTVVGCTKNSR